ncbi:hypothetical protein F442_12123 [Phytophthora nicotianae P10297]|uniref:Uncharacterized protein n=1 Tax=Phytophthora nicotianae P10297 TaxID=1317064 RepID=W2Z022_PHYNI|nr:hypothetical protein F442_12123 [Phytophthora nicotianae P10297]
MLDVKGVGSNLTLAEQDEAIADLTFFFDEFGSTGAVRDKLEEQESDIKLLHHQIRRLLNHQSDGFVREEGERDKKSRTDIAEDVDETMKNLDFFIRTFGSTRQVREKLERQRVKVVGLRRTVRWLKERQPARVNLGESSDVEVLAETSKSNIRLVERQQALIETMRTILEQSDNCKKAKCSMLIVALKEIWKDPNRFWQLVLGRPPQAERRSPAVASWVAAREPLSVDCATPTVDIISARLKGVPKEQSRGTCAVFMEAERSASLTAVRSLACLRVKDSATNMLERMAFK